jgi:hypothetical protein
MSTKDSWLPSPTDSVQHDINATRSAQGIDSAIEPFVISSLWGGASSGSDAGYYLTWSTDPKSDSRHLISGSSLDFTLASIFTTSLEITNDSAATAMSTIITILTSMAYYDQFPNFAETAHDVRTAYTQTLLFPRSLHGLMAVMALTIVHYILVLLVIVAFITRTRLTTLGDHWQTLAQSVSPATESFLARGSRATDEEVRAYMKVEHREREIATLQLLGDEVGRVGLVSRRVHRSSSRGR